MNREQQEKRQKKCIEVEKKNRSQVYMRTRVDRLQ